MIRNSFEWNLFLKTDKNQVKKQKIFKMIKIKKKIIIYFLIMKHKFSYLIVISNSYYQIKNRR